MAFILTQPILVQLCYIATESIGEKAPSAQSCEFTPYLLTTSIPGVCCNTPAPLVTPVLCKSDHLSSCSHGGNCHPPSVIDFDSS